MKISIIEWDDVTKEMNEASFDEDRNIDDLISHEKTIGWVYKETDKTILLVQEFDNDKGKPRDWVVIPKVLITKMEEVK
jgi:hypothetical protein